MLVPPVVTRTAPAAGTCCISDVTIQYDDSKRSWRIYLRRHPLPPVRTWGLAAGYRDSCTKSQIRSYECFPQPQTALSPFPTPSLFPYPPSIPLCSMWYQATLEQNLCIG